MGGSFTYGEIGVIFVSAMGHLTLTLSLQPLVSSWLRDLKIQPGKGISSLHWCSRVVSVCHAILATCKSNDKLPSGLSSQNKRIDRWLIHYTCMFLEI